MIWRNQIQLILIYLIKESISQMTMNWLNRETSMDNFILILKIRLKVDLNFSEDLKQAYARQSSGAAQIANSWNGHLAAFCTLCKSQQAVASAWFESDFFLCKK